MQCIERKMNTWLPIAGMLILFMVLFLMGYREGFYVPLGYVASPSGYTSVSETTQKGSTIPVSTNPEENDLLHKDTNNYNMSFHSVDAAQYFNIDAIDKQGNIKFNKLHDLFPKVQLNPPVIMPTYADSVLFSSVKNDINFNQIYQNAGVST